MDTQTTGQIISEHRKKKGLTQRVLADQLNVTDKAVSKWERDVARPDINTIPKLAEILDVPIELLINIPISAKVEASPVTTPAKECSDNTPAPKSDEKKDFAQEAHKDNVRRLLLKGLIGFAAGFIFVLITALIDEDPFSFTMAFVTGLFLAGVPYGWELLTKIIGNWYVVGSIPIMIIVFMLKLVGAVFIGWAAYPIALLYNLIKSQRRGSKLKTVYIILLIAFICIIATFLIWQMTLSSSEDTSPGNTPETSFGKNDTFSPVNKTEAQVELITDSSYFNASDAMLTDIYNHALSMCAEKEQGAKDSGHIILSPSAINAVYFLTVKEPNTEHYDFGDNIYMSNAVAVVTSYKVNIANVTERYEYIVWFYPDFALNAAGTLVYETEAEHSDHLGSKNLEDVYKWICDEFDDMTVTELSIPN